MSSVVREKRTTWGEARHVRVAPAIVAAIVSTTIAVSAMSPQPGRAYRLPDLIRVSQHWSETTPGGEVPHSDSAVGRKIREVLPSRASRIPRPLPRSVQVGRTYRAAITEMREGEALVEIAGKEIRLSGAHLGDEVTFLVTDDLGAHAAGYVLSRKRLGVHRPANEESETLADEVHVGETHNVVIANQQPFFSDGSTLTWIGQLPVIVRGAAPGERVTIRVTKKFQDWAVGEIVREERDPFRPVEGKR